MKEYRYGTFRLADNLRPLTAICIFVLFSVMSTSLLRIFCKEGLSVIE